MREICTKNSLTKIENTTPQRHWEICT